MQRLPEYFRQRSRAISKACSAAGCQSTGRGDGALYDAFARRFADGIRAQSAIDFVEAKLAERDARHVKLGDSRYVLEPNIKEGKGGLRDLHTLWWLARWSYCGARIFFAIPRLPAARSHLIARSSIR